MNSILNNPLLFCFSFLVKMSNVMDLAGRALWPVVSAVNAVGSFVTELNPSTLSGAIDIIVSKNSNELSCSPFHVRFGKLKLLRPSDKVIFINKIVHVYINDCLTELVMKVGEAGEAFFVVETENHIPPEYVTSPIVHPSDLNVPLDANFSLDHKVGDSFSKSEDLPVEIEIDNIPISPTKSEQMKPTDPISIEISSEKSSPKKLGTSPPWVWNWGRLPHKGNQNGFDSDMEKDMMSSTAGSPTKINIDNLSDNPLSEDEVVSVNEKVSS